MTLVHQQKVDDIAATKCMRSFLSSALRHIPYARCISSFLKALL